jgi:hypothetical protein
MSERGKSTSVIQPFTRLRPEVVQALTGWDVSFVDVSGSNEAYWQLLADLWAKARTFIIVEQDVVVRPDSLDELIACQHPWCSFQVPYVGRLYAGLSCAKFSAGLIARYPDALERIAEIEDTKHTPSHWCTLDSHLQCHVLNPGGETMHVHGPELIHLRDDWSPSAPWAIAPTHDCWR